MIRQPPERHGGSATPGRDSGTSPDQMGDCPSSSFGLRPWGYALEGSVVPLTCDWRLSTLLHLKDTEIPHVFPGQILRF